MNTSTFSGEYIDANLRQLNASKIKVISGKVHIVDFDLGDGLEITYVFSLTNEQRFHLQRANPYAMTRGIFANEKEIINFIKKDVKKFRIAKKSKNFRTFIDSARSVLSINEDLEKLFLSKNVSSDDLRLLDDQISTFKKLISEVSDRSGELTLPKK